VDSWQNHEAFDFSIRFAEKVLKPEGVAKHGETKFRKQICWILRSTYSFRLSFSCAKQTPKPEGRRRIVLSRCKTLTCTRELDTL
jgi:hypothetical protein